MAPKKVDKDARRKEIALAALESFAEHGVEATSIAQIAEAAGIGKGTIYEYFASKEALTVAAAVAWVEVVEAGVEQLLDPKAEPEKRLRILCQATMQAFLDDPRMVTLFFGLTQIVIQDPELMGQFDFVRRLSAPMRDATREILLDGVALGHFRPEVARDVDKIAINLFAYLDGVGMHHMISPGFFDLAGQVDFYLDNLLRSLRAQPPTGQNHEDP